MAPNDERRPGEGRRIVQQTGEVEAKRTTRKRQKLAATHVLAECTSVIGGTGRQRTLLIYRCPFEGGAQHVAHGRGDLPAVLERPSACRRGQLALHPIVKAPALANGLVAVIEDAAVTDLLGGWSA